MPTYGYHCSSCGHELEAVQKISEDPLVDCPLCGKKTLKRGIGGGQLFLRAPSKGGSAQPAASCCPCGKTRCS